MAQRIGIQIAKADGRTLDAVYDSDSVLIGSGSSAVLRLDDPGVSSIHAVVKLSEAGVATVVDLGSEGGTTVNGAPVTEPVTLKVADVVAVGGVKLTVTSLGAEAAAPKAHELAGDEATVQVEHRPPPLAPAPKVEAAPQKNKAENKEKKADMQETQVIRERKTEADVGSKILTEASEIQKYLLETPLDDANKPTAEERVLEVTVYWGDSVIDTVQVAEPRDVLVGNRTAGDKVDLQVDNLPADKFTIAHNQGSEAQIVVPADAKVGLRKADGSIVREVQLSGTDAPFPAKAFRLQVGDRLVYKWGTISVVAQFVRGNAKMGRGAVMDWYFPRVFAISALLHIFFVVAAFMTPDTNRGLMDELFKNQNRFAQMILKAPEEKKQQKKLDLSGSKGGAKHKDEEGKFGKKDQPQKDALASKAGAPRVDPNKREKDRQIALNSGLLGMLKGANSGAVSNVFGPGGLGTGINNAMGGLRGSEMGDAGGAGGLGSRGTGAGGGGSSLGIGGLGTHGHGRGTGGYGNIDLGGRGKGTTRIVPGRTIIEGSLSKEEIGRVIRRNLARFKFCYEKELNTNPNLSGKISVYFTIAPTGSVADASVRETSMNDENVESCVTKVMRSLKFPQPRGGGIVVVTYPFVFAAS